MKPLYEVYRFIHIFGGLAILVLTMVFTFMAIAEVGWKILSNFHSILGLIILIIVPLNFIGGTTAFALLYT
jgi:hypothetical protein